uniref:Epidermal growth factor-like protein 7 n=1 Tax=Callithrix jacchus TaxID=9483 RepID=A0A8I3WWR2_CALJA
CPRGQLPHPQQSLQAPHTVAPAPLSLLFVRQHVSVISGEHTQEVRLERAHPNPDYPGRGIKSRPSSPGGSLPAPSRLPRTASREAPGDRTGRPASGGASRQGPGCIPRPGTQQQQPWPRLGSRSISPQGPGGTGGPAPRSSCSPGPRDDGFSSDRTIYRTAYRRSPGLAPARPRYTCCPGWKRTSWLPGACGAAICQPPCRNGGSCVQPGHCRCPSGWQGDTCQSDVDECSAGRGHCPQRCINTAGSYWCQCWEGHSLSADGTFCVPKGGPPRLAPNPTGVDSAMKEEVQRLRSRVDLLEEKLQLVLAPLHSLASQALELGLPDPGSLLVHSLQQLGRIDSLSEQISFLEEQLGSCSCKDS